MFYQTRHRTIPTNKVTVQPVDEPVSIEDVKANVQIVDNDEDDGFIRTQLIPEARRYVENLACRSLMTQTRVQYYDDIPCGPVYLRYGPVQSVSSFSYVDSTGVSQTLATTEYEYDLNSIPARLWEAYGKTWPTARGQFNSVGITYVAGYGSNVGKVPIIYRRAIIYLCTHWYQNRDQLGCTEGNLLGRLQDILAVEGMTLEYA